MSEQAESKYRILETNGVFNLQIKYEETTGFWFWKKTVTKWRWCNKWGGIHRMRPVCHPFMEEFKTLEAAKDKIKELETESIQVIHYV